MKPATLPAHRVRVSLSPDGRRSHEILIEQDGRQVVIRSQLTSYGPGEVEQLVREHARPLTSNVAHYGYYGTPLKKSTGRRPKDAPAIEPEELDE